MRIDRTPFRMVQPVHLIPSLPKQRQQDRSRERPSQEGEGIKTLLLALAENYSLSEVNKLGRKS